MIKNKACIDKGYLLSPKDLCSLELLPELIQAGVHSFKIEGRMKSPEYVATVTRIYRKYIDMVLNEESFQIAEKDIHDLKQVFNRGGFSSGHLCSEPNRSLIFKEKPNNMGIYIGSVSGYNSKKGHITINLADSIGVGDTISFEKESSKYTISELMIKNKNISSANIGQTITVGRMKGNIHIGDKIYKMASKELSMLASSSYQNKEQKKIKLNASISIQEGEPITLLVKPQKEFENYKDIEVFIKSDVIPVAAVNSPIKEERILAQLTKTKNTPFTFDKIEIDLGNNLYLPNISILNQLRRSALSKLEESILEKYKRKSNFTLQLENKPISSDIAKKEKQISLLLNTLNLNEDYSNLQDAHSIYIPLKYFASSKYSNILSTLCKAHNIYIYLPTIIRNNFKNLFMNAIEHALGLYPIRGFVVSNIGTFELLKQYIDSYEFIGNYTLNIFNSESEKEYLKLGLKRVTLSPELNKQNLLALSSIYSLQTECIVYGRLPLMTTRYCLLGKSNKCYPECSTACRTDNTYYLKDRMGFNFRIIPDDMQTITTIYNSKITSISSSDFSCSFLRIDTLDESIDEINTIISKVKNGERLEGSRYTNGNLYRNL